MPEEYVLRIPAKLEGMDAMLAFVGVLLDAHGCSAKARKQLRMAVEELYVNIALYAYSGQDGWAELRGSVENDTASFLLIDGGKPFDPLSREDLDTTLPGEERGLSGMGIYMVKTMVDEMEYEYYDDCNHLTIRKHL